MLKNMFKPIRFPISNKAEEFLDKTNYFFLTKTGLPRFVAPHLYFGDFDNIFFPQLKDWQWITDWKGYKESFFNVNKNSIVIGSSDEGAPIFIKKESNSIYTFVTGFKCDVVLNSCVEKLSLTLNAFARIIDNAFLENPKLNLIEQRLPKSLMGNFLKEYREIEPSLNNEDQYWKIVSERY